MASAKTRTAITTKVEVYVRGERLNDIGLLIDFKDLKAATPESRGLSGS